jgi:hypothetical protein
MPLGTSSRLVSEIATAVKRQFGDESGTQINDTDILRWVNQGQEEIALKENTRQNTITTLSVAGQSQYTLPGQDVIKIMAIHYSSVPLQSITFEEAQISILATAESQGIQATPTTWYEFGDSIFLYPSPSNSLDVIMLYAVLRPAKITTLNDTITIPDSYYNALVQYVLAQAYELDDDFDKASFKLGQLNDSLSDIDTVASLRFYPTITVAPEDM